MKVVDDVPVISLMGDERPFVIYTKQVFMRQGYPLNKTSKLDTLLGCSA